ncbi:UDP-N-acetylglucosamine transferase subunit ALG14-like protein isoform X2 [Wolffia australiana]
MERSDGLDGNFCSIYVLIAAACCLLAFFVRFLYVLYHTGRPLRRRRDLQPLRTLVVLGSGGHTAEMLNLLAVLDTEKFKPRFYVSAKTDSLSLQKAEAYEKSLVPHDVKVAHFMKIYRSREVGQSYITSVATTLVAIAHALWLTFKIRPQVVICNGPGTCIPLCACSFLFKMFGLGWSSIFYVESIARVKRLSLTGLLLYHLRMADQLFVQWPYLKATYPRAHYVGPLM